MLPFAPVTALVGIAGLVASACGTISHHPPPELPGAHEEAPLADGEWHWRREHTADGVHRLETERWHLTSHGDELHGYCDRRVELRATDGQPFRCSQSTTYALITRYYVSGTQDGVSIRLREDRHEAVPSPCETGVRRRAAYRGVLAPGSLRLAWDDGEQLLERVGDARPATPLPTPPPAVNGAWQWSTRHGDRSESETWLLEERAAGTIHGSYRRTVTDGECVLVERYRVHGHRDGTRLSLAEVEADVEPADCEIHHGQRHLDSARGTSYGDAIVLVWRGGRRQVLARQRR